MRLAHAAVRQRLGAAADLEHLAVGLGVLDLHALQHAGALDDEVGRPVLAEGQGDAVPLPAQVRGDRELRDVPFCLSGCTN